jgi:hypothetical protein
MKEEEKTMGMMEEEKMRISRLALCFAFAVLGALGVAALIRYGAGRAKEIASDAARRILFRRRRW